VPQRMLLRSFLHLLSFEGFIRVETKSIFKFLALRGRYAIILAGFIPRSLRCGIKLRKEDRSDFLFAAL